MNINKILYKGFTLLEILLVISILGIMIAVIVPRAYRAQVETKYTLIRQSGTELGKWGMEWAGKMLESQDSSYTCVLNDYVATLCGYVGDKTANNWVLTPTSPGIPAGTCCTNCSLTHSVKDIMPADKQLINPFNGLSYFNSGNDGSSLQTGVLYLGKFAETSGGLYSHYYFVFTGEDSTGASVWHGGMGSGTSLPLANLRNGIFMAQLK